MDGFLLLVVAVTIVVLVWVVVVPNPRDRFYHWAIVLAGMFLLGAATVLLEVAGVRF